jgi:acetyl-CoA C-acetyltransferase
VNLPGGLRNTRRRPIDQEEPNMSKGKLAIVGVGEVPTGTYPERSRWDIIYETCMQAVRDAGIDKNDVEGVITVAPQAQPRLAAEISFGKVPEELGLKNCKYVFQNTSEGSRMNNISTVWGRELS